MKKAISVFALLTLISVGAIATRSYLAPTDAALSTPAISDYLGMGFSLDDVTASPFIYKMAPTGIYSWGTVTINLHGRRPGPIPTDPTAVTITCHIEADATRGVVKFVTTATDITETVMN